jgi:hypothetical protein
MMHNYWRTLIKRACQKTRNPLGLTDERLSTALALVVGTLVVGGVAALIKFIEPAIFTIVGLTIVGVGLFVWQMLQAQAAMYRELDIGATKSLDDLRQETGQQIQALEKKIETLSRPAPNYDKWRHHSEMTLRMATQLWVGEQPSMRLIGQANETYEMLRAAVKKREVPLVLEGVVDPRMLDTAQQMDAKKANAGTVVTRKALQAFASRYGYDPEFLRDSVVDRR